ncbi:thiamine pyrophosphate-binding protein [Nakamurella leprariae]|uniref:Thiamine pyrophosphate-binding protein n=1 Tax=Nakamurella leprariae TaxID=2803911 RepID=A0A939C2H9_9ACTN|nr:thiamine pyrophosphate-binding protein [Nakamurella leprariae]MBM9468132.1 thiamine pyrophosphate-binding protein [Nakamurella leprariae]
MTATSSAARTTATARTCTEELADVLVELGCEHLFTLMGAGNLWLIHHLDIRHGVPVHHLRHENGAVGAADGYARATGRLGWCTVTQGPGFTNTITALLTADRGRVPMVLLVSDTSNLDPERFPFAGGVQALAPELLLAPIGIATVRATGSDAAQQLREAAARAVAESRPIVFVMPAGLDRLPAGPAAPPEPAATVPAVPVPADEVNAAADAIDAAEHVVLLAGLGAVAAGAGGVDGPVARLAELLGARVTTTVPAAGILGGHPAAAGPFGGFSIGATERLVQEADCIVAIGASLNLFQTRKGEFTRGRTVVRIDTDPAPARSAARTVSITGDARVATEALVAEFERRGRTPVLLPPLPPEPVVGDVSTPGRIDPRALAVELDRVLPADRRIFVDNGHFGAFPMLWLQHRAPRSLIWMPDFGAVGSSLAASYAGAVADPHTQSVLFIGDCGLYLTLGDLETAVRERTPLVVVCMNDGAAGSELAHMKDWGVPPDQAVFGYADLAALGAGMGAQAAAIHGVEDLAPALAGWRREDGPLLLDCHISREVRSPIYDHV